MTMYRDNSIYHYVPSFVHMCSKCPIFCPYFPIILLIMSYHLPIFSIEFVSGMMISKIPWFPPQDVGAAAAGAAGVERLPLARRKLRAAGDRSFRIWKASDVAVS
jgi:hypothetical protein